MSRKLAATVTAIAAITGLVLGLAVLTPAAITSELAGAAIAAIAGLGGYQVARQARIDERP